MPEARLVIIDDNSDYLAMIAEVMADAGFTQVYCAAGKEAFPTILEQQPDLVLLDINTIAGNEGWDTLYQMRLTLATNHIPVLVCTTDPHIIREKSEILRAQGCDLLEKPFDLDTLLDKLNGMLDSVQRTAPV